MAYLRDESQELFLKVLYFGASASGKTTNLQSLFKHTSPHVPFRHFDLAPFATNSPFFEFLPLELGALKNYKTRLHLYTVPSHDLFTTLNHNLVAGMDGAVFVLDSRLSALAESERHLERMNELLRYSGRSDIPLVLQLNHRDAPTALPIDALKTGFCREGHSAVEAVAAKSIGVNETLEVLLDRILAQMNRR